MSKFATLSARLLIAGTLLTTIGAAPAVAKPWDATGGKVFVNAPAGIASPVVLKDSFTAALSKAKVTVTARSGATTTGPGKFSFPVRRIEWFATDRTLSLSGALHRGTLEFKGRNGLRVAVGNINQFAGAGVADLYVNGSRLVAGLPLLECTPLQGADYEAYYAAIDEVGTGIECPLRFSSLATSVLNGLTGSNAFGRGTFAYAAVVPNGYNDPALAPIPPNSGTN